MAGSVNKVILVGHLGKDPETRSTNSGSKICNLTIATSETWNDKQSGERKEVTQWHRIVIFNERLVDVADKYLKKGRKVYLEGALETRKYTNAAGAEVYTTEVVLKNFRGELVLLDSKQSDDGGSAAEPARRQEQRRTEQSGGGAPRGGSSWDAPSGGDLDDSIPF